MDAAQFIPVFAWLILSIVLVFRQGPSLMVKILGIVCALVFTIFWWSQLSATVVTAFKAPEGYIMAALYHSMNHAFLALTWLWPFTILFALISKDHSANGIMLILLTAFTLLVLAAYLYFGLYHLR